MICIRRCLTFVEIGNLDFNSMLKQQMKVLEEFELLGWDFAKEGRKCVPFGISCKALGVVFNLKEALAGIAHISNTASRVEGKLCV